MTQEDVAEKIGMTGLHYGRLERGERNVSLAQLERIAKLFEVSVWTLVRGAFPDEAFRINEKEGHSEFVQRIEHLSQSLNPKEQEIVLELCRLMAHGK